MTQVSEAIIIEKDQHIRELETRMTDLHSANEMLRANVDESNYWIYDRGPIEQELRELRQGSVTNTKEINRLTRENVRLMTDVRRADAVVTDTSRSHPRHEQGHPPQQRATITQTFVNNLFARSRDAQRQNFGMDNEFQKP